MGFRNPITSATDLDTTQTPGGAGVIIEGARATFQPGAGEPGGYIEPTSSGGGSIAGAGLNVVGPFGGITTPMLSEYLEEIPAGGYRSVTELVADAVRVSVAVDPLQPSTELALNAAYFAEWTATESAYDHARYVQCSDGQVQLWGMVKVNSGTFSSGTAVAGPLPVGCRPLRAQLFLVHGWGTGAWLAQVTNDGYVRWIANVVGGTTVGSYLSLAGITFLAQQ